MVSFVMALKLEDLSTHTGNDPEGVTIESYKTLPLVSYKFLSLQNQKLIKDLPAPKCAPGNYMVVHVSMYVGVC